jgi:hypothetical protein
VLCSRGVVEFLRRDFAYIAILCVLAAVLGLRLHHVITTALFEAQVRNVLKQQARRVSDAYIDTVRFEQGKDGNLIRAVLRGPDVPSAEQVAAMQAALPPSPGGGPVTLRIRFVRVVIMTAHGPFHQSDADHTD